MITKCFKGANAFLSRNLIAPEIFDAVHDALKQNGAEIFLCSDPSRNGPDDYHVISSDNHVKFDDLKAKGCNLLGPQCVISCAKENRSLPKRGGFTCCLAMDGVKVIASGFDKDEKAKIEKLVTSMGGVLQNRASLDVNFVMVKNVLAAKYKWALTSLKKPIVTMSWLHQCWKEHRLVPQEPYRVLPFSGLTICVTRLPADVRKDMENLILQNGGQYSADLTKKCTHLISDAAEGDKYKVARKWGHIHIVTKKWFDQSIAKRSCLEEDSFPVQGPSMSLKTMIKGGLRGHHSQDKGSAISQSVPCTVIADSEMSSPFSDSTTFNKEEGVEPPALQPGDELKFDGFVADDSQSDNDLYLSDCRIVLTGFQAAEMRKLVCMVRRGGGSRYMSFSEKLTHIVVGEPSENEKKEVKRFAALGVIHVVRTIWLEDCDREKREMPVTQRHIVSEIFFPTDSVCSNKAAGIGIISSNQSKSFNAASNMETTSGVADMTLEAGTSVERNERKLMTNLEGGNSVKEAANFDGQDLLYSLNKGCKDQKRVQPNSDPTDTQYTRISNIFKGMVFRFSSSFPEDRRTEIVEWVNRGGGDIVDDHSKKKVQFTIECHGQKQQPSNSTQTTIVSSHWIRSCLEDGSIQDVGNHIIYSPLPCHIPLPGFDGFRICVSQYEEKDKLLLRNLCFVLGAKFTETLSKKVTHLICKFTDGPKYLAACEWGIKPVTFDWISECIRQDAIVSTDPFRPKDATAHDREAGLCTTSQHPTQAAQMVYEDVPSQLPTQSQVTKKLHATPIDNSVFIKRARLMGDERHKQVLPAEDIEAYNIESMGKTSVVGEVPHIVPDVAAAIEDLLEQSNKIQDMVTSERPGSDRNIFSPDRSILGQDRLDSNSTLIPNRWLSRTEKQDDLCNPPAPNVNKGTYDGFSETQTDSQVVGYEEDLSGIQMIIDKARARSSLA